jgi:hypothetical protein
VSDGSSGALGLTAFAENYAAMGLFYYGAFFSVFVFKFEHAHVTVFDAFSAAYAFFVVYCWTPRYLFSGNTVVFFLCRFVASVVYEVSGQITIFKYCYRLFLFSSKNAPIAA